ncbi:Pentatricopeptide repeat-containing protein, chloroplastic [Capsicum annuum]|nr:Pentatricopeptide repeat-containing protein, chloroplastic [Capsicum annuum]
MFVATCELVWIKQLMRELKFGETDKMKLVCDNLAALRIPTNTVFHERTKHIEIDCHFFREKILSGDIVTKFVKSGDQLVVIFTKSLTRSRINYICNKLDGYSYSIMISAFCRSGLLEDAKELASEFEEKYDTYDVVILNAMLSAYCRAGELENVMSMMKKMDDYAISPDWNTFNILVRYFCKEKLYLLAYRTMEDMHRKGHQLEEGLCSSLIYHLGQTRAHSEAFSVYNMLRYSKRTISKALHENILHILIAGGLLKDAYVVVKDNAGFISQPAIKKFSVNFMRSGNVNIINDVIKTMHSSGHKIDQELFDMAMSRYIAKPEKKELLVQLLKWMPGQGYAIDSSTRNLILKNSHLFGHQLIAETLSKQLVMSKKVKPHKENAR